MDGLAVILAAATAGEVNWTGPEGVTAVATLVTAVATGLTVLSVFALKHQTSVDCERSRREIALEVMRCFATSSDPTNHKNVFGLELLHSLSREQCRCLWDRESFEVASKQQQMLENYRKSCHHDANHLKGKGGQNISEEPKEPLKLTRAEILTLRRIATSHLNKLEFIASAWHDNVADRTMIEREFVKVFCPKDGEFVLENFWQSSGIYPSVRTICDHYRQPKNEIPSKPPIR